MSNQHAFFPQQMHSVPQPTQQQQHHSQLPGSTPHQRPLSLNAHPPPLPHGQQQQYSPYSAHSQEFSPALSQASSSFGPSRSDGPAKPSTSSYGHQRGLSGSGGTGSVLPHGGRGSGPYTRPSNQIIDAASLPGPAHPVKASSTTSEFTKRKNWSQHIIDEIQDFMHVVSPEGRFILASPSIEDLAGWTPDELVGKDLSAFVHADDLGSYHNSFAACLEKQEPMTIYYRFKTKDERYILLEVTGHGYYGEDKEDELGAGDDEGMNGDGPAERKGKGAKCLFGMARPYPSKNQAMLDSFLELKVENERLRQELLLMYNDLDSSTESVPEPRDGQTLFSAVPGPDATLARLDEPSSPRAYNLAISDKTHTSGTYGALGIGITSDDQLGHGQAMAQGLGLARQADAGDRKKKKVAKAEENEFVCRDCGTVDSPEWRKGPDGPKSLCNACGLRYAKVRSKENKLAKAAQIA